MTNYKILFIVCIAALFQSCSKDTAAPGTASLTIVNTVVGSNPLVTNFSDQYALRSWYINAVQLPYGSWGTTNQFSAYSGSQPISLYSYPDTTDKSVPWYSLRLDLPVGTAHSLFLTGTATQRDTLFTTDNPPYHPSSDSSVGVRFINLSPGAAPVNVTLSTSTTVNEFSAVAYKGVTTFKNYPAIAAVSSYTFQFRDAGTGAVLASYTMNGVNNGIGTNTSANTVRFRNVTIALIGSLGGSGAAAQKSLLINNY